MRQRKPPLPLRSNSFKSVNETKRLPDTEAFFVARETERLGAETCCDCNLNLHRPRVRCVVESCE